MKGYGSWGAGWAGGEESTEEINMKHLKGSYTKDRKRVNLQMTVKQLSSLERDKMRTEMSKKEQGTKSRVYSSWQKRWVKTLNSIIPFCTYSILNCLTISAIEEH